MMSDMKAMRKSRNLAAVINALIYCLLAGLWVVFSDRIIDSIAISKAAISSIQTMKGLPFVIIGTVTITAPLVFILLNRSFRLQNRLFNNLVASESPCRVLFEHTEISIWHEDLSEVSRKLEQLRTEGVMDLRKYLRDKPKITRGILGSVKVLQVNDATLKLFGATTQKQFLSRIDITLGSDTMEVFIEELCAIWEGKSTFSAEAVFLTFDGREITAIISFRIPKTLEEFASVPVIILDITDLKQAENRQQSLGRIIDESLNEIFIFDQKSLKFLYANKGAIKNIGYTFEELMELTPKDIDPQMTAERFSNIATQLERDDTKSLSFTTVIKRKNGTNYPIEVYLQANVYENRNTYVAIIIDITEREANRRELLDKEEIMIAQSRHAAMGEMIGMIAHQWRQPISVIAMGANNLLVDIDLDEVSEENIKEESQSILKQTEYLSKTIDDFKNFFRPNKEIEEVGLEEVMAEAEKIIGKSLEYEQVVLSIKHEDSYRVKTYSRELLQVYINLLKNAKEVLIESRVKGRQINVVISDDTDHVITTICDNGRGIDESIIEKIFDPYFSTKDEKIGTGLGLYMSKTIIEKHLHGTIEAYNTEDGACFKIAIPVEWGGD